MLQVKENEQKKSSKRKRAKKINCALNFTNFPIEKLMQACIVHIYFPMS